ncbi:SH3 domain-containing protein [Paraburkholderia acidisoli]|uniref:SH3 domain-containing protein n=1 Tax=Paraburkholderia acidisoli TaxID=2571748 RepID=A0A7Z2GK19_9BURK|nr:SH3 domain-containing protein [Paraburkholderia acidisoli]QGZ63258.1 SH3 domain-containing protein [Paraburkholderia acidisoli]
MRKQFVGVVFAGLGSLAGMLAAQPALAQSQAFTSTTVNVYAGPGGDYPVVAQVSGGVSLAVMGCVAGYSWCDVSLPNLRGWVYGSYLSYPWQGQRVPVPSYGATIGLPIVTFSLGAYWGNFYRDRPWYGNQGRWSHHPGPRPVPPPPIRPPRPHPPGHGAGRPPGGPRPPSHGAGPGPRPPGHGAGPGNGGARPPSHGGGRPPGGGGGRPPGGGGHGGGGGGGRPPGGGGGGGGGRPGG